MLASCDPAAEYASRRAPLPLLGGPGQPDASIEFLGEVFTRYGLELEHALRQAGALANMRMPTAAGRRIYKALDVPQEYVPLLDGRAAALVIASTLC
jgi:hypothetical protein